MLTIPTLLGAAGPGPVDPAEGLVGVGLQHAVGGHRVLVLHGHLLVAVTGQLEAGMGRMRLQ